MIAYIRHVSLNALVCLTILLYITIPSAWSATIFSRFYKLPNNLLNSEIVILRTPTSTVCLGECELRPACRTVCFNSGTLECKLAGATLAEVEAESQYNTHWDTYAKYDPGTWIIMFHGFPDVGGDPYHAWLYNNATVSTSAACMGTSRPTTCTGHFRSRLVDSWWNLGINQVKISVFVGKIERHNIIFNGVGANLVSWFDKGMAMNSTWNVDSVNAKYFSLEGHSPSRRFFISGFYNGCESDMVLLLVVSMHVLPCNFDYQTSYPKFIFATGVSMGYPESGNGTAYADMIRFSVKLQ